MVSPYNIYWIVYWKPLNGYFGIYQMQHKAAFFQGLHCLLRLKKPSGTEIHHNLDHFTYDPLKYTLGSPIFIYQYVWGNLLEYNELTNLKI